MHPASSPRAHRHHRKHVLGLFALLLALLSALANLRETYARCLCHAVGLTCALVVHDAQGTRRQSCWNIELPPQSGYRDGLASLHEFQNHRRRSPMLWKSRDEESQIPISTWGDSDREKRQAPRPSTISFVPQRGHTTYIPPNSTNTSRTPGGAS